MVCLGDRRDNTRLYPLPTPLCLKEHTEGVCRRQKSRGKARSQLLPPRAVAVVSEWVVEEREERRLRRTAHQLSLENDWLAFHRKRQEDDVDCGKWTSDIHLLRDEGDINPNRISCTYSRMPAPDGCNDPEPYNTEDGEAAVRPRTVGYSNGHMRSMSPTPDITWGGRQDSHASVSCPARFSAANLSSTLRPEVERPKPSTAPAGAARPIAGLDSTRPFTTGRDHLDNLMCDAHLTRSVQALRPFRYDTHQRRLRYAESLRKKMVSRQGRPIIAQLMQAKAKERLALQA
ncbi:unnamed protein product, partial [Chrysoparadoxa australica]